MSDNGTMVSWDKEKITRLYAAIYHAVHDEGADDDDTIMFDGHELVIGYAKHLYAYLVKALAVTKQ